MAFLMTSTADMPPPIKAWFDSQCAIILQEMSAAEKPSATTNPTSTSVEPAATATPTPALEEPDATATTTTAAEEPEAPEAAPIHDDHA